MSNLKEQIKSLLDSAENDIVNAFFDSDFNEEISKWDSAEDTAFKEALRVSGITVEHVDNYGGEDQGSEYWSVYSFTKGTEVQYVKFNGWYQSYNGSEYDEWYFAKPVPKSGFDFVKAD